MNNNDDLLKNYIESQKRQNEILEEAKKRRLKNKNNAEQTKKISQDTKDELKNDRDKASRMNGTKTAPEFFILAEKDYEKGNFKEAITFLNKAIEIDPLIANYYLKRGLAKMNLKFTQDNLDYFMNYVSNDPELRKDFKKEFYEDIENYRDVISDKNLDYQSAIDDYDKALEINPRFENAFFHRGCLKEKLENYQSAINDYNKALEINPKSGNAFCHRGWCKCYLSDFDGAIIDFTKAIENPKDEYRAKNQFIYVDRAEAKFRLEDYQGAIDDYDKAIEMEPEFADALNSRGRAKFILKDYQGAIDDYDKAIEIRLDDLDESDDFYFCRAIAKEKLGDNEGAIDDCNKALEIDPNNDLYSSFREDTKRKTRKLEKNKEKDQNLVNQNKGLLNIKKVKGKYLGVVNDQLSKEYSEDEIAIACGYFKIKNKIKVPLIEEYLAESSKSVQQIVQLKNKCSTEDYYLTRIDLGIFKERLYEDDGEEHGRDIYIPKRIVENSQDWNYKTSDFEDFDMEYVEYEDGLEFFESYIAEKYTEEELKRLDKEKEFLKFYGFSEPMMIKYFSYVLFYVDHYLKRNNNESFEYEDIAEAQGIRYSDIQEIPHDAPYFSF